MKTLVLAAIGLVVIGGSAAVWRSGLSGPKSEAAADEAAHTVRRGSLVVTITENGSLMAKKSEKITFQRRRGGGKITFLIEEGKTVEPAEVLCKLDTQEIEQQIQQLDLDVQKTEVELKSSQNELNIQKEDNSAEISKAKIALEKAQKELEKWRDGDAPKERRSLEIKIKEAETTHSRAKKKYEDSEKLLQQDYITKSQVEQDKIEFERAEIAREAANRDLDLFEKYTLPITLADKQTALEDATRGLKNATSRAESNLDRKDVAVKGNQQRLNTLKDQLKDAREELEKCTIKAPSPGLVLHGDPQEGMWGNERLKLGGNVWGGQTLFTIPDLRVMQVVVQVHEADINKLKDGLAATITMDTYPGLKIKGTVQKIAQVAGSQNPWGGEDDVKKFKVEVVMEETPQLKLRPGISAKVEVFIEERKDVIAVPRQAVFLEDGLHFCLVIKNGGPVRTPVKVDVSNDTMTQVIEGLSEGDRVMLYNPALGPAPGGKDKKEGEKKKDEPAKAEAAAPAGAAAMPAGAP